MPLQDPPNRKPARPAPPKKPPPTVGRVVAVAAAGYAVLGVCAWWLVWRPWRAVQTGADIRDPDTAGRTAWGFGIAVGLTAVIGVFLVISALKDARKHEQP